MKKLLFNFEPLRKWNKDVPQISKSCEIDLLVVDRKPQVYTRNDLRDNAEWFDKGELLKRGLVQSLRSYLTESASKGHRLLMSLRPHEQLKTGVEPYLNHNEVKLFCEGWVNQAQL